MTVIVTGSLGFDYIMDFSGRFADRIMPGKIHKISLAPLVDTLSKQLGGTAGNISYSLKLLGIDPYIIAPAGNDFEQYENFLKKNGIRTDGIIKYSKESSGTYFVVTDKDDNQIGAYYKGALKYADKLSIVTKYTSRDSFIILTPTEVTAMNKYANECQKLKLPYLFDPAFQIEDFSKNDLAKAINSAKILIGNDYEIALIEKKLKISHVQLKKLVPILITTLGSHGSIIESQGSKIQVKPAKPVNISDPTGAGDAYRAGFLAGFLRGFDLKTCGQIGSVAAVYTVEKYGTQTHTFTIKEFCQRYKKNYGKSLQLFN